MNLQLGNPYGGKTDKAKVIFEGGKEVEIGETGYGKLKSVLDTRFFIYANDLDDVKNGKYEDYYRQLLTHANAEKNEKLKEFYSRFLDFDQEDIRITANHDDLILKIQNANPVRGGGGARGGRGGSSVRGRGANAPSRRAQSREKIVEQRRSSRLSKDDNK